MEQAKFDAAFKAYVDGVQRMNDNYYAKHFPGQENDIKFESGKRYIRVYKVGRATGGGASVHSFVDKLTGNILKGSWKAPVKNGVRGSIFAPDNGMSRVNHHGTVYLRGGGWGAGDAEAAADKQAAQSPGDAS